MPLAPGSPAWHAGSSRQMAHPDRLAATGLAGALGLTLAIHRWYLGFN